MPALALGLPMMDDDGRLYPFQGGVTFTKTPENPVTAGGIWLLQPIVQVLDASGALDTSFTGNVTLRVTSGTLSGTVTIPAIAGVATFVGLSVVPAGTTTLIAEVGQRGIASTTLTVT